MEKFLRPARFGADPHSPTGAKEFKHWLETFNNFLTSIADQNPDKLKTLINYVTFDVFNLIEGITVYEEAIAKLKDVYVIPTNAVFARYVLASRKQKYDETIDVYVQSLRQLARDCNFEAVSAMKHCDEAIRDAMIAGISSNVIRQRLLENKSLDLQTAIEQARTLESANRDSEIYAKAADKYDVSAATKTQDVFLESSTCSSTNQNCFFCGNSRHPRLRCPAREAVCHNCLKKGHFSKVCKSPKMNSKQSKSTAATSFPILSTVGSTAATSTALNKSTSRIIFHGKSLIALVDSGSCDNFVTEDIVTRLGLPIIPSTTLVSMATSSLTAKVKGYLLADVTVQSRTYKNARFSVLSDLCYDVILGRDFMGQHESVEILFGGKSPKLTVCGLAESRLPAPNLFSNLSPDCHPIATPTRRFNNSDRAFIDDEISTLLQNGIIETSSSPWRAQVVITTNERHKRRLVIDYSRTINRYTELDAYPLPRIDELAQKVSEFSIFSTIDLRSAYHQISISDCDRPFTAFEANGNLYQFCRLPFGVTNGVACFQRSMDNLIRQNHLHGTFAYLDNLLICGKTKEEHDTNLDKFMETARRYNLTFNDDKCEYSKKEIKFLGYSIANGTLRPDPERLRPLKELPLPTDISSLRRCVGLFSYYSQWVSRFSDRIAPLARSTSFPLSTDAVRAFEDMKDAVEKSVLHAIDDNVPFVVETDASDHTIAATLNQSGRPVAFFSRMLSKSERKHSSVEKEAYAIVEALRKWRHYLVGRNFTLVTDQKSVSFMFNNSAFGKTKNDKIQRWRLELIGLKYDIIYRAGTENLPADALSRVCSSVNNISLQRLHEDLCHPGLTRLAHFVKMKNLPHSIDDIRNVISKCSVCAEMKPSFYKPPVSHLIKATQPFERLSVDFKGPLPTSGGYLYLLTIVDEFSRFPFAFPCSDISSSTVIKCFNQLFAIFGMPAYIHSDRGTSFMSKELADFLTSKGIATSRTTPYNPQCNGQTERYNGIIWNAVKLALRTKQLDVSKWCLVLADALHSIRSLLCTATNCTPHERFFNYQRRSCTGYSIPSWLTDADKVLLRRHVRHSKHDPLVDEVKLVSTNPNYALVRFDSGREDTVSIRDLAPCPQTEDIAGHHFKADNDETPIDDQVDKCEENLRATPKTDEIIEQPLRRSQRIRTHPVRFGFEDSK